MSPRKGYSGCEARLILDPDLTLSIGPSRANSIEGGGEGTQEESISSPKAKPELTYIVFLSPKSATHLRRVGGDSGD